MNKLLLLLLLSVSLPLAAAQHPADEAKADAPSMQPPKVKSGEVLEPDVTIIEQEDKTIEQYSVNGHMYMVKVTPRSGPPYYLIDSDGDGELDIRSDDPGDIAVPQWVLFSW